MNITILNPIRSTVAFFAAILVAASPVVAAETSVASGSWSKKEYSVNGSWKIVEEDGVKKLKLVGFKTRSAPDLKIFFSPKSLSELNGKNATSGSYKLVKLKSAKGDQTYTIPAGVDLDKYKSIVVHCEQYSKLWAGAAL
ncbi:MAG: DM13 domain-containing protein [Verrucomicrobiota bacterium]